MLPFDFLLTLPWIIVCILHVWFLLLYFQQEEYDILRYIRWWLTHLRSINPLIPASLWMISIILFMIAAQLSQIQLIVNWVGFALGVAGLIWSIYEIRKPMKLALKYTPRVIRLILTQGWLIILISVAGYRVSQRIPVSHTIQLAIAIGIFLILYFAAPLWNCAANLINAPLESLARKSYYIAARKKIRSYKPAVIGITGSYGKTSTKDILAHILSASKKTLPTPKSFNTLMGVTRVINDSLKKDHEVFLVEMGAYKVHEVDDIARLVKPSIGVLTAIGPQHLERFGTLENVAKAKFELFAAIPPGGTGIFNLDDVNIAKYIPHFDGLKLITVSASGNTNADLYASDLSITSIGLAFTIHDTHRNRQIQCQVNILGRHNITNILLAVAASLEYGLPLDLIKERLRTLAPTPHRLQLIQRPDQINIIDDSYNSNPVGVKMALETLALFNGGKKILVTPGMIELGPIEEAENYRLGVQASSICDQIILVGGEHTRPIYNGVMSTGYNRDNLIQAISLNDAMAELSRVSRPGDTILLLNDLPDLYERF